jgi:hypothetical protein
MVDAPISIEEALAVELKVPPKLVHGFEFDPE